VSFNIVSAKISGIPNLLGWTQVHEFKPEEEEKLIKRGHLFAVFSTKKKEEGVDSVTAGRELLSRLHEEYFGNLETPAYVAIKSAVSKVADEFLKTWGDVEIAVVVVLSDVVYSAAVGGSKVVIYRNGSIATILESNAFEVITASGYPKEGDNIILGSKLFFENIPTGTLKASLEGPNLAASIESLAPQVSANENSGNIGNGSIATILESNAFEVITASGYPKEGDNIILGSKLFFENIPTGTLKASLEGPNLAASIESLAPQVSANENSGNIGAVVIGFDKKIILEAIRETIPMKQKVEVFKRNTSNFFSKFFPERKIFVKEKMLDDQVGKGRKTTFYVGIVLLILLFVSIGFGIKQNLAKKYKSTYLADLTQAISSLDEAETLFSDDPKRARELFLDSKSKVENLIAKKIEDKELISLETRLKEKEAEIMGIINTDPSLYLDLSLLSSGFGGDKVIFSGGNIFVFDKNGKKVVKIAIDTKKTQVVVGPEQLDGALDIFAYQDSVYGVFSDGLFLLGTAKKKIVEKTWDGEVFTYAYTGNIYLLDKTANAIWRYAGSGGSFGAKQNWLATGTTPNFENVKQIVIDGTIWVLTSTSNISRFSQGNPVVFKILGVSPNLTNIQAIHTNEDNKYVYLLDKEGGRIVVLEKDGNYKAQYQSDQFKEGIGESDLLFRKKPQRQLS